MRAGVVVLNCFERDVDVRHPLLDHEGHPAGSRANPLEHRTAVDVALGHDQTVHVDDLTAVLRIVRILGVAQAHS